MTAGTSGSVGTHIHRGWELCTMYLLHVWTYLTGGGGGAPLTSVTNTASGEQALTGQWKRPTDLLLGLSDHAGSALLPSLPP